LLGEPIARPCVNHGTYNPVEVTLTHFASKDLAVKRLIVAVLAASGVVTPVLADQALAQKKNCMACHAVDKKVVGPAYKDVAKKYDGQNVAAKLATKVMKGGAGTWGAVPMPANPQVSQAEADTLVKWVLSLK
jgi:cytochrome c